MFSKEKAQEWIEMYLKHIEDISIDVHVREHEGYKFHAVDTFQKYFDIEASDLGGMLEKSLERNNLVVGVHYFPRKMLLIFAKESPNETREILRNLFNEDIDIVQRINDTVRAFDALMEEKNKRLNQDAHTYIQTRFLSLLLSFRYPEKYNPIKPREWKVFCGYVNEDFFIPNHTPEGEKYKMISDCVEEIREIIKEDERLFPIKQKLVSGLGFSDVEFIWTAQDVVYTGSRILDEKDRLGLENNNLSVTSLPLPIDDGVVDEKIEEVPATPEMRVALEKELESIILENWDQIDFGEKLELYVDEDGEVGRQFRTNSGAIDILAFDEDKNFVVLELKRGRSDEKVVGQILHYMSFVRESLAVNGESVRGIIVVSGYHKRLVSAVKEVSNKVQIKYYRLNLTLETPEDGE